jgi:hypothetical protein
MVKHDLTVRVEPEAAVDVPSDPILRKFVLSYNVLIRAVTRVTQHSVFCGGAS